MIPFWDKDIWDLIFRRKYIELDIAEFMRGNAKTTNNMSDKYYVDLCVLKWAFTAGVKIRLIDKAGVFGLKKKDLSQFILRWGGTICDIPPGWGIGKKDRIRYIQYLGKAGEFTDEMIEHYAR